MNALVAAVSLFTIFAVVVIIALFRMGYVRASGSLWRASFEIEAADPKSPRLKANQPEP